MGEKRKQWYIHTREYHSSLERKGNFDTGYSLIKFKDNVLSEISQSRKDK
jgi:hypothetical protein